MIWQKARLGSQFERFKETILWLKFLKIFRAICVGRLTSGADRRDRIKVNNDSLKNIQSNDSLAQLVEFRFRVKEEIQQ